MKQTRAQVAAVAGLIYWAVMLGAGVILGTVRTLFVAPAFGPLPAVLIELPVMLAIAWIVSGAIIRRVGVARRWRDRLMMGAVWFGFLLASEVLLSGLLRGLSLADYFQQAQTPEGQVALLAFLLCATFPLLRLISNRAPTP